MLAGTQKPMLGTKLNRAHPLAKGLVGCWLFNEGVGNKAYDLSGYGNHGTLNGMAFPPTVASGWNPNKDGVCLAFDGSNDYVNCGNNPSLDITDAITIKAWVKTTSPATRMILSRGDGTTSTQYEFDLQSRKPGFASRIGGVFNHSIADTALTLGIWHHVVVTFDGSVVRFYSDGNVDGTDSRTGTMNSQSLNVLVGARKPAVPENYFDGSIDGVKIYNRALGAEDIKWLYHAPYCMFERGELLI